jgi:argininosuccinate lyase
MGKDLYRDRLKVPLDKEVLDFISSLKDDLWIVDEDIIGTEVHNIMLYEQNILTKDEIKSILIFLERLKEKFHKDQIELDNNFEDIHPFIEKCVIDEIGIDIGGKIHTGRSRNDQVSVDIRLKIRSGLNLISKGLINLLDVFLNLSKKSIDHFIPLYTHFQRGQLGVFAHYVNNYIAQILRTLERIEEIYHRINLNPLGACAIGGTSINISRERTAELLGFEGIVNNSIDAISSRDYIYEPLMCLSLLAVQFSRISEDLLIWSSKEFGFIELDDQFCSVSSVMPQKKNPDTLELIRSKSSKVISNLFTASTMIKAIPTGYFRDFQELKPLLRNSFETLISIVNIFIGIISSIKLIRERMLEAVNNSYILALDLAELLVQEKNIPFRQSHSIVASLIKESKNPNDLFNKEKLNKAITAITNEQIEISDDFIKNLRDLNSCLNKRTSQGSPSKKEIEKTIKSLEEKKEKLANLYENRIERIQKVKNSLKQLINELTS